MKRMYDQILRADSSAFRNADNSISTKASAISKCGHTCPVDEGNEDALVTIKGGFAFSDSPLGPAWRRYEPVALEDAKVTYYIPIPADLHVHAMINWGAQIPGGGYQFVVADMVKVVAAIGKPINVDPSLSGRTAQILTIKRDIVARIERKAGDVPPGKQWVEDTTKGQKWWELVLCYAPKPRVPTANSDEKIRCLETPEGQPAGWAIEKVDGVWSHRGAASVKTVLQDMGHPKPEAEQIMGRNERHPWKLVSRAFEPEYPGERIWNKHATQWAFEPVACADWRIACPHWHRVFSHVGANLNEALVNTPFSDGADYLLKFFASIAQDPGCKTPYLFLFGPENSGKSIIHEAFALLVTGGVVKADRALTSQSDFNGELEGSILCVVEEKDVARSKGAHAKIKDAVTAIRLSIRRMRMDSYMVDNTTHWVQCSNNEDACLVTSGDTRVQPIYVSDIDDEIPKTKLLELLKAEAPAFIYTLLNVTLPPAEGRLRLPVIETATRSRLAAKNMPDLIAGVTTLSLPWSGTAKQLCKAVGCAEPQDFRPAQTLLEKHDRFLRGRRIKVEFPEATGHKGKKIVISKMRSK